MMEKYVPENLVTSLDVLLRGEDVARILNVSRSMAYQLIQRGEVPSVRLGRAVRVRPQDLANFISRRISSERELH
jgi:excisionase family DNA binding protein